MKCRFVACMVGMACMAAAVLGQPASNKMLIAPLPIPLRVARADVVITGKVTKIEDKTVTSTQFPGNDHKVEYQIAVVQVDDPILNAKGIKEVRVGFVPLPGRVIRPGGIHGVVTLKVDDVGLLFLTKHFEGDFYTIPAYFDIVQKENADFEKAVAEAKKDAKMLADPMVSLKAKNADERFVMAAMLVEQFRTDKLGSKNEPKEEMIDAAQSKLILSAIRDADWAPPGQQPRIGMPLIPQSVFGRLGLKPEDNWTPPVAGGDYVAAAQQWLKDNAETYRIKKFVTESKGDRKKDSEVDKRER
jgi:hypothetical protein